MKELNFLSFGAGVQSSVMLMKAIRGELPRPDYVVFADTGFEPSAVYLHVDWAREQCWQAGLEFVVVKAERNLREEFDAFEAGEKDHWNSRPALYVINHKIEGSRGTLVRQCTRDVKVRPIQRFQREVFGVKSTKGLPDGIAVAWVGISTDEARRASPSQNRWEDKIYPLIDPLRMSRADCQSWWQWHCPDVPLPTSSCTICPYRADQAWLKMKEDAPEDFAEACDYDRRIRAKMLPSGQELYLHRSYQPLEEVDLNQAQGAFDLDDEIYCSGGCGL